jgi:ankyrin repeat protein
MLEFAQGHELMKEAEALRSQLGWEVDKFEQSDGALPYDSPTPMESSRTTIGATTTTSILQPSDEVKQSALDNNLRVAAEEGNLVSVELLLRRGANPNAGTEVAVLKGHKRVLEVLFDKGAEPNLDAHTWKLLKLFKCWDMIEVLLLRGANPPSRESLMFHAASASQQSIVEILLRHTNPVMAITGAAIEGDEEAVKRILQSNRDTYQGVESEKRAPTIWTELRKVALEKAARFGHVEVVKLLLEEGADPNDGFENAASHGNIEILKLLLERGADTKGDQVGIFFAALWGDKPSVELLVESGASIDAGLAGSIEGKNGEIATYLDQLGAILPSAARGVELHAPTLEELKMERYLVEALADRKEDLKYYGLSILSDIQISEYVTQNHRSSVCLGIYGPKANTRVIVKLRHAIPGSHPLDSLKWEVQRLNEVWTLQKAHGL